MELLKNFKEKAASDLQKIVFAEGEDERIIKAAEIIKKEGIAEIVILGNLNKIEEIAAGKDINLEGLTIIDPEKSDYISEFREEFYELRKHKGISKADAELISNPISSCQIIGIKWKVIFSCKTVLSLGLILATCSPQSGG